ncbi:MAG: nuclear transport factor 2 family protein [Luteimonas sp.]
MRADRRGLVPLALAMTLCLPAAAHAEDAGSLVRSAFEAWRDGRGAVFDLLADDVVWTVAGDSPVSGVYRSRQAFLDDAVAPITARLATPIVPTVERIVAEGDHVVVLWQGSATTRTGATYRNHYAWHLQVHEGRIVRATAFLDTWALARLLEDG